MTRHATPPTPTTPPALAAGDASTLLDRLSTLATQSASAASSVDRTALNAEYSDVLTEITREGAVAGLDVAQGFSVFISAESTASNGKVAGTIGKGIRLPPC